MLAHVRARVRPTTYEDYKALSRCHVVPHLAKVPLVALRPPCLQSLYSEVLCPDRRRALSGGTVLNTHLVLTQALGQAVRWGLLPANAAAWAQPPRPRRPDRPMSLSARVEVESVPALDPARDHGRVVD